MADFKHWLSPGHAPNFSREVAQASVGVKQANDALYAALQRGYPREREVYVVHHRGCFTGTVVGWDTFGVRVIVKNNVTGKTSKWWAAHVELVDAPGVAADHAPQRGDWRTWDVSAGVPTFDPDKHDESSYPHGVALPPTTPEPSAQRMEALAVAAALIAWKNSTPVEWCEEASRLRATLDNASRMLKQLAPGVQGTPQAHQENDHG